MKKMIFSRTNIFIIVVAAAIVSCKAKGDYPGSEFAPQMYHSVPYEALSQVTDEKAGTFYNEDEEGKGEFYNSNPYNPYGMTMREPAPNTVKRTANNVLPYRIHRDSVTMAARVLKNPLDSTQAILDEGRILYTRYCAHCHGGTGQGDGPVAPILKGVPSYTAGNVKILPEGHVYHVITHGIRRMGPHGSQIDPVDRWKIVHYVQTLQKQ